MGHKIFVSYKYADDDVKNLNYLENSTVRDYVDELEKIIDDSNHIFKGESDGEDLSELSEEVIWSKLKDRIYDSTLTIVFISPQMKEDGKTDKNQWIPWEISYSLKETKRKNESGQEVTSKTNAMMAVVLPDSNNSYNYYLEQKNCCPGHSCITHHRDKLFEILKKNKFNLKEPTKRDCTNDSKEKIWLGDCSFIKAVKWNDFIADVDKHIDEAYERLDNIDKYNIYKEI